MNRSVQRNSAGTPKSGTPGAVKSEANTSDLAAPPDAVPAAPAQTTFDAMVQAVSIDIDF